MNRISMFSLVSVVFVASLGVPGAVHAKKLPVFDGRQVVASVNGDPITVEEFNEELASMHERMQEEGEDEKEAGKIAYDEILNRMIDLKLYLLEARNIGIDQTEEVRSIVRNFEKETIMKALLRIQTDQIVLDEQEVSAVYRDRIREVNVNSLYFIKQENAEKFMEQLAAGGDFEELGSDYVRKDLAKGTVSGDFFQPMDKFPGPIREGIDALQEDEITPLIEVNKGWVVVKYLGSRFPENEETKENVRKLLLRGKIGDVTREYAQSLVDTRVKIDEEALKGFDLMDEALDLKDSMKDQTVLADIDGEKFTIGDFSKLLDEKFYHGIEKARVSKDLNQIKEDMFRDVLFRKMLIKEAYRQKIDQRDDVQEQIRDFENKIVFGKFIEKVIYPQVTNSHEEVRAAYEKRISEFTTPDILKLHRLIFETEDHLMEAVQKYRKGTDFKWISQNAPGRIVDPDRELIGNLLSRSTLPEDLKKAVEGKSAGDVAYYTGRDGGFYLVFIENLYPGEVQPFDSAKDEVALDLYNTKINEKMAAYGEKLRDFYEVRIYDKELR